MNVSVKFPAAEPGLGWMLIQDLAPHLLWAAIIAAVILLIGPRRVAEAVLSARKIGFAGIEIELKGDIADAALARKIALPIQQQEQVARRIERSLTLFGGARFLWIDDAPAGNVSEIRLLRRLGTMIDLATDDATARQQLAGAVYDIVLSDMGRGGDPEAGEKLIPEIRRVLLAPNIIFYVGKERVVPPDAFGLTTRPDELLNLIMDALERKRA